jgi:alcohol dehydrogenase
VPSDSGVHAVNQGAELGRTRGADSIASIGGGSVIETAKEIAILLKESGSLLAARLPGFQMLSRKQTPHICALTTAGTGSEATYVAVVKDHESKRKLLFADHHLIPDIANLDPMLTVGPPPLLTAATGLDAFCHGLEALTPAQRAPIADALGLHALRLIRSDLPIAVRNGTNIARRATPCTMAPPSPCPTSSGSATMRSPSGTCWWPNRWAWTCEG